MNEERLSRRTIIAIMATGLVTGVVALVATMFVVGNAKPTYTASALLAVKPSTQIAPGDTLSTWEALSGGQTGRVASEVYQQPRFAAAAAAVDGAHDAAICAPFSVERHRLVVLADKIADHDDAVTRFVLLTRPGPPPPRTGDDLTSLVVYIAHDRVGALLSVLMELAVRGVNLTRIESRPTGEALGRYAFFLDCTGHVADDRVGEALQGLYRICARVLFLGSYPRHRRAAGVADQPVPAPAGLSDDDYADAAAWLARLRAGELT